MRWGCWRWWPARTSNRPRTPMAPTGGGGAPARSPTTGSSPLSTPETRHTRTSKSHRKDGYRGHVAAEPETGLITDCELTTASGDAGSDPVVGEGPATATTRPAP